MCFHNSMSAKAQTLAVRYGRKTDIIETVKEIIEEEYHINAFSNPECAIITSDEEIQAFIWGLIPFWAQDEEKANGIRRMTYNARSETIFKLPSFREPILKKRCLVPSTGYFEYHHNEDETTTPYYIYLPDEEIFSFAGIYDIWHDKETGEIFKTFSIITTDANKLTAEIHNGGKNSQRMPVILPKADEEKWLDGKLTKEQIESLMKPFDAKQMDAYTIHNDFIKKSPKDKSILEKA